MKILKTTFLFTVFFSVLFFKIFDLDFWWHLATGKFIFLSHHIPTADIFSWTIAGKKWIDFEWFSQLIMFLIYNASGIYGIIFWKAAIAVLIFLFLVLTSQNYKTLPHVSILILAIAFLAIRTNLVERPQLFTYLFIAMEFWILESFKNNRDRLYLIPIITLLWANLHGGACIIGVLMPLIFGLSCLGSIKKLFLISIFSVLSSLLNPVGLTIYVHLIQTITEPSSRLIAEWLAPDKEMYFGFFGFFIVVSISSYFFSIKPDISKAVLLLASLILSVKSQRHIPIFVIITALVSIENLVRTANIKRPLSFLTLTLVLLIPTITFYDMKTRFHDNFGLGTIELPVGAVDFIKKNPINGKMFNVYDFGGYLIYNLPEHKVFVDGRNVEYGSDFINDAMTWFVPTSWAKIQNKYKPDFAIVDQNKAYHCKVLDDLYSWKLVYWDDSSLIYIKSETGNDDVIKKYGYKILKPNKITFDYLDEYIAKPEKRKLLMEELGRSNSFNSFLMRGQVFNKLNEFGNAIAEFEKAIKIRNNLAAPYSDLGIIYLKIGDWDNAIKNFKISLSLKEDVSILNNLGIAFHEAGNKKEAIRTWERILKIDPSFEGAKRNLDFIKTQP